MDFCEIWGMGSSWYRKHRVDSAVVPPKFHCFIDFFALMNRTETIEDTPAILAFRTAYQVGEGLIENLLQRSNSMFEVRRYLTLSNSARISEELDQNGLEYCDGFLERQFP